MKVRLTLFNDSSSYKITDIQNAMTTFIDQQGLIVSLYHIVKKEYSGQWVSRVRRPVSN